MKGKRKMSDWARADRIGKMLLGILLIGMCVAAYRISLFGVDAFSCMNLGISGFLGISFGTWQLIMNAAVLIVVFFTVRENIGLGTIVNMVCVGYIADLLCWIVLEVLGLKAGLFLRIVFMLIGTLFASFGCALYMEAQLGIAPYDSVAFVVTKVTKERISFRLARVMSDVTVVCIGVIFCLAAHNPVGEILGLGTIVNAFCNGPLIQFFRGKITKR